MESHNHNNLQDALKPFYHRASEAEDRLARLEAAIASKKDAGSEEHTRTISELRSKLEITTAELVSEREKSGKLAAENTRLQYRITHLLRSLKDADLKLENISGQASSATAESISKLSIRND